MLIYLLRHGQTEYNAQKRYQGQRDIPLSAAGIAQLRQADFAPAFYMARLPLYLRGGAAIRAERAVYGVPSLD